ncbi:MAG: acetylxylan esterase [Candidatus Aminicenantes bacterium]|nr:MAG: acetylxylan esterase [Candidatus Aminicenantes bacterium]
MKQNITGILIVLMAISSLNARTDHEEAWLKAEAHGRITQTIIRFCNRYAWGWFSQADPKTGLLPRTLEGSWIWNAKDCAADNFPFLLLTGYVTGQHHLKQTGLRILTRERELTPRLRSLPDTYDFAKEGFSSEKMDKNAILFGASEYIKDGLMPVTECLGPGPWMELFKELVTDIWAEADFETAAGKLPTANTEVHGELLQSLSRLYWITSEERFKDWAFRLADYYLLHQDLIERDSIRLRDHGCEILSGLSEAYLVAAYKDKDRHGRYQEPLYRLLDNILEKGINPDGMMPDVYNPRTGDHLGERLADSWGYVYNAFLTVAEVDGKQRYREAVRHALDNVYKYLGQGWEGEGADGYADSVEGALNLINRIKSPAAERWIDESIPYILAKQREDGIIEGWYGDGNSARTTLMTALWKTQGVTAEPWREDLQLGAVLTASGRLLISLSTEWAFDGRLHFDQPRHRTYFLMPLDYPRINQFPEWFTVDQEQEFLISRDGSPPLRKSGKDLLDLPVKLEKNGSTRIVIESVQNPSPKLSLDNRKTDKFLSRTYKRGTPEEALEWQEGLRRDLAQLMKITDLMKRQERYGFDVSILQEKTEDGFIKREIEFRSTPSRRIRVILTLPQPPVTRRVPAVVCLHGHGGSRYVVYQAGGPYRGFATELARRGFVTIAPDVGQHDIFEEGRTLMGERLWDAMRCVDYLESLSEVDPNRIGCAGLSLGGEMAMWLAAMDARIRAAVSSGFLTVMDQMERNHCLCWKFDGLRELVDFPDIYAMTAPRALQCQNGRQEPTSQFNIIMARYAYEQILPAYLDFNQPDNLELNIHDGAHVVDVPPLVKFLAWHLGK